MRGIYIQSPPWLYDFNRNLKKLSTACFDTVEKRMQTAIDLADISVYRGGGPFGAIVFQTDTYEPIAASCNLVMDSGFSIAHAEILALTAAQQQLGTYDLDSQGAEFELVTSCAPCCMCLGAALLSGVKHLVCGARTSDAEDIGYDEGPKPSDWVFQTKYRHVSVIEDVLRYKAQHSINKYRSLGGKIY